MKIIKPLLLSIFFLLHSCALKPITSEYTFVKTDIENVDIDQLGNGQILIYNSADILHKLDNTARLNVWIDNKQLGQIRPSEYVIINFKPGQYEFKLLHIDFVKMSSNHTVIVDKDTKIIKIKPTVTSNRLDVTNEIPENFNKFNYAEKH
ncbi:hypothetical protein [Formosa sp. PL04]|uniref:hypothetical protein n=1 Tax=Formosa sp. PL04 TaxID=3081755 RepID=UPI002981F5C5|nr:hypothetical protein [Formosa sp. PL04]MDW5289927.1 hypothetical protein [Formosa sp. PL04]